MIVVVTGAPCSGKSTHIQLHATPGDVVIDMDRIALALSIDGTGHHDYPRHIRHIARAARSAAATAAIAVEATTGVRVWIIDTFPDVPRWRGLGADIVTVDPGYDVCMARAAQQRPDWITGIIAEWYAKFA